MGWMPDFGYQRSQYKDNDKDAFKFMRKKKKKVGELGVNLAVPIKGLVNPKKKPKGL